MKLRLERPNACGAKATISKLFVDDEYQCLVLEDVVREVEGRPVSEWKVQNCTAIPRGTYKVIKDFSNHFGCDLPHILDVPGFSGVRIHSGNTAADTEGCLLVGIHQSGDDFITESRLAFSQLMTKLDSALDRGETISLKII